jgi:hypothetical protein
VILKMKGGAVGTSSGDMPDELPSLLRVQF